MESLIIYLSVFIISLFYVFCGELANNKKKIRYISTVPFIAALAVPVFLAAVRVETGTDWASYFHAYDRIMKRVSVPKYVQGYLRGEFDFEIGYYFINRISFYIRDQYSTVLFISSAMTLGMTFAGLLKYKKNLYLTVSWYAFLMLLYAPSYNAVRQSIAVSAAVFGSWYLYDRKFVRYFAVILMAALFHRSALVCFIFPLFYILDRHSIMKLVYYVIIVLTPLSTWGILKIASKIPMLDAVFAKYQFLYSGGGIGFLIDVLMPTIPLLIYYGIIKRDRGILLLFDCYLLKIPFRYFAYYVPFLERLMEYSVGIEIVIISMLIRKIEKKNNRIMLGIYYTVWYFLYFIYRYMLINTGHIFPYQFQL